MQLKSFPVEFHAYAGMVFPGGVSNLAPAFVKGRAVPSLSSKVKVVGSRVSQDSPGTPSGGMTCCALISSATETYSSEPGIGTGPTPQMIPRAGYKNPCASKRDPQGKK